MTMADVAETVRVRDAEYGGFEKMAQIGQDLKRVVEASPGWGKMNAVQREAMHMILHKIGRLCSGNPSNRDGWHDIQGYGKLVEDRLPKTADEIDDAMVYERPLLRPGMVVTLYSGDTLYVVLSVWADRVWLRSVSGHTDKAPHTRNVRDVTVAKDVPMWALDAAEAAMRSLVNP